jgi:hypothetical protein
MRRRNNAAWAWPIALGALLCLGPKTLTAGSEKFWRTKPVAEWSRQETVRFLSESPWVRRGTVELGPGSSQDAGSAHEGLGQPHRTAGVAANATAEMPEGDREWVYYVQWDSAQIVRDAMAHLRELSGKGRPSPEPDKEDYLVSVTGPDINKMLDGVTVEQLEAEGHLHAGGSKTKIHPTRVVIRRAADSRIVSIEFTFPRMLYGQPVIPEQVGFVRFYCKVKGVALRARFELPEMITANGLDR